VRLILAVVLLLLGIGCWCCRIDGHGARPLSRATSDTPWVRTVDGWERPGSWHIPTAPPPVLHPLVLGAGQLLLSLFALTAFTLDSDDELSRHESGLRGK
jgi:hypothetical protein